MSRHREAFTVKLRSPYWYWKPAGGKWTSTGIRIIDKSRTQIIAYLAVKSRYVLKPIRFEDFAEPFFAENCEWAKRQKAKGKSLTDYWINQKRQYLINYILPIFRGKTLQSITPVMIENWLAGLNLSSQTKKHIAGTLKTIMKEAYRSELIERDPFARVEPIHVIHGERSIYTLDELRLLFPIDDIPALKHLWGSLMVGTLAFILLSCGLRSGEGRALQWGDILTIGNRHGLRISRAVKGGERGIGSTKAGDARAVLLPEKAYSLLMFWKSKSRWIDDNDLIVGYTKNQPISSGVILRALKRACKLAGIDIAGRDIHCLRHTYRTIMAQRIPEAALNYMIGHKSAAIARRYNHTTPEDRLITFLPQMPDDIL